MSTNILGEIYKERLSISTQDENCINNVDIEILK